MLALCLLVAAADNLCKQFGPRSKLFDTLMVFTKEFFVKKLIKKKICGQQKGLENYPVGKGMENYPVGKELTRLEKRTTNTNNHAFNTSST